MAGFMYFLSISSANDVFVMQAQLKEIFGLPGNVGIDPNDAIPVMFVISKYLGNDPIASHRDEGVVTQKHNVKLNPILLK